MTANEIYLSPNPNVLTPVSKSANATTLRSLLYFVAIRGSLLASLSCLNMNLFSFSCAVNTYHRAFLRKNILDVLLMHSS